MPTEVRVPVLGESIVEATVGAWLKRQGEQVEAGEPLVQLETEKVNVDVSADASGVLGQIRHAEGETVRPGDVLVTLEPASAEGVIATAAPTPEPKAQAEGTPEPQPEPEPVERPHASPVARRMADEQGIDLGQVQGTGTGGRVTREDIERHLSARPADGAATPQAPAAPAPATSVPTQPAPTAARSETRIRMTRRRQTIAQRLLEAQRTAAMLTTFNEADMSAIMAIRARRREAFLKRHGVGLGFMSFFTRAVVGALKAFPNLNAELRGDEIVQKHYYDIGIAVGAEEGLVVPVLRDADRMSFAAIELAIRDFAKRANDGTLTLDDLKGGTFTITNGGVFGSLMSTPILNPPQVGILGLHKIQDRPVAVAGKIELKPMMYVALSYDHRIVDGAEAVRFLVKVKELVEDPGTLLIES
jgi:2-oxoglutarate dehydrogenase E2 component (dihydrolipoamide succinyltransferase)